MIGQTASQYRVLRRLGAGGMARSLRGAGPGYFRVRLSDPQPERITAFQNFRMYPGPFGPGDVLLTVRGIRSQEIHAFDVEWP